MAKQGGGRQPGNATSAPYSPSAVQKKTKGAATGLRFSVPFASFRPKKKGAANERVLLE